MGVDPAPRTGGTLLAVVSGIGFALIDTAGQTLLQRDHAGRRPRPRLRRARGTDPRRRGRRLADRAADRAASSDSRAPRSRSGCCCRCSPCSPSGGSRASTAAREAARGGAPRASPRADARAARTRGDRDARAPPRPGARSRAGTVVIREGDAGRPVVPGGTGRVRRDDRRSAAPEPRAGRCVRGDRAAPRRAADGDGHGARATAPLWALERDEFLAGVTGSPTALREAERVATARLG